MVEPAYTDKSTLSVNYGPQFAKNQPFDCATQTALRGRSRPSDGQSLSRPPHLKPFICMQNQIGPGFRYRAALTQISSNFILRITNQMCLFNLCKI